MAETSRPLLEIRDLSKGFTCTPPTAACAAASTSRSR